MVISFYSAFINVLLQSVYGGPAPDGTWRFGLPPKDNQGKRMYAIPPEAEEDLSNFGVIEPFLGEFGEAFTLLDDDESRKILLLRLMRYIFGKSRVSISMTPQQYKVYTDQVQSLMVQKAVLNSGVVGIDLNAYDLNAAGIPIRLLTSVGGLVNQFFLQQYEFKRGNIVMGVEEGDTVIEGGMCWGDSALNFAHKVGPKGKVIGFEFEPRNLQIIAENFKYNPQLAKRITIVHNAMLDKSGETLTFTMAGPATGITFNPVASQDGSALSSVNAETLTIDDLVERDNINKVDFIKLDIEGAELQAMHGAEKTLRRFRPKLALSAYHRVDDIPALTKYLHSLNLGYKFWLDHFKPDANETMLFAKTEIRE